MALDYDELAAQAVEETRKQADFAYSGPLPLGETWALTFGKTRDSGLLAESNFATIYADMKKRFPRDVEIVGSRHWAHGHADEIAVRMLNKDGSCSKAGKAALDWQASLEDYPVADDSDYSKRQYEETLDNIQSERGMSTEDAEKVFGWLWNSRLQSEVAEGDGDQAPYPSGEAIDTAMLALGMLDAEDAEDARARIAKAKARGWRGA